MWTLYVMECSALREAAEFEKAIGYVDKARAARLSCMRQEHNRVQSLAAGLLLSFVLENFTTGEVAAGINTVTVAEVLAQLSQKQNLKIHQVSPEKTELGKPYFSDCPEICFSISHSGDYVLCAMAEEEVGADIQQWRKKIHPGITGRVLHTKEVAVFEGLSDEERERYLFTIWAAKEAFVKRTGDGLSKDFRCLYTDFQKGTVMDGETGSECKVFFSDILAGYTIALCI